MSCLPIRYAITNRSHYGSDEAIREAGLLRQTEYLANIGIDFIQLREKDLNVQDLLCLARKMLKIIHDANSTTRLLINSRADIASAAGVHGVHLTAAAGELIPAQIRQAMHRDGAIISVSCHTLEEVQRARNNAADIILFGPVFGKSIAGNRVSPGTGLDALASACRIAETIPVLALGGITIENTASCLDAGAKGVAAIRLFQTRQIQP